MVHNELKMHQYDDATKNRYYADSERVSEDRYDLRIIRARMNGAQSCFATCSRITANGLTRWTHTQVVNY